MSTFLPFNYNPTSATTLTAESGSYTVPTGHYAFVKYCINVDAGPEVANTSNMDITSGSDSVSGWVIVMAGDEITRTETAASASSATTPISLSSQSIGILLVEASPVATCTVRSYINRTAGSGTITIVGTSEVEASIEVYAIP